MSQEWLIRTKDLFISRPLSEKDLKKKIEKGDLNAQDEICPAAGYWFSLHETNEVRKFFGDDIDLSKLNTTGLEIEITSSTETQTLNKTKILEIPKNWPGITLEKPVFPILEEAAPAARPVMPQTESETKSATASPVQKKSILKQPDRQWAQAIIFATLFLMVLILLWMSSD